MSNATTPDNLNARRAVIVDGIRRSKARRLTLEEAERLALADICADLYADGDDYADEIAALPLTSLRRRTRDYCPVSIRELTAYYLGQIVRTELDRRTAARHAAHLAAE